MHLTAGTHRSKSLRQIAAALNARGIATARGGRWKAQTVANVLKRVAAYGFQLVLDQTTAPPALRFAPQCRRRVPLRPLRELVRGGLIVSDPVSKNAARAMTTAVSKPMADKKTTALAGSDIAHCLSGRLFPSVTAGESRHDRRFAHSRFASTPIAALVPAIRLVRRDLHAQCPLHGFRQPQPRLAPPRSAARRRRASSPGRP